MPLLSTRGAASARGFGLLGRVKALADPFFNYVTLLLHGDGTNGAQNNTFLDSSTNNFTITRNGNTTQGSFSPYGPNWSNYFAGSGNYLTVNTSTGTGTWTAECWVFIASPANDRAIFGQGTSDDTGGWLFWVDANGTIRLYSNGNIAISSSGAVASNTWVHLALVSNSSNVTIYVNGTSVATGSYSGKTFTNTPFQINRGYGGPTAGIDGYISNARLVVGTAVYTSNFTPPISPLTVVANTRLLTCADNRFIDDSTNNFAITVVGSPSVQRFSPFAPPAAYSPAAIGGSGYFDGAGDFLSNTTASIAPAGDFTYECWYYRTATATQILFSIGAEGGARKLFGVWSDNQLFADNFGGPQYFFGGSVPANAWTHIAFTRSGSTVTAYINGVATGTTQSISGTFGTTGGFYVGAVSSGGSPLSGYLSNSRLVNGSVVYTANFTPPAAPVTAITNTSVLTNFINGAIFDNAMMNDLETVGNAQISTSVVKYGTGSLSFNSASAPSNLVSSSTDAFALRTGDFTIEGWVYPTQWTNDSTLLRIDNSSNIFFVLIYNGQLCIHTNGYSPNINYQLFGSMSLNTWNFISITRAGGVFSGYVNGVKSGNTNSTIVDIGCTRAFVGEPSTNRFIGFIDDLRITKGVARYTANFTPPTAAFPNQ